MLMDSYIKPKNYIMNLYRARSRLALAGRQFTIKKKKKGEWLKGWYVCETDNCKNSVFLDENYQPLQRDIDGCQVWNYRTDVENLYNLDVMTKALLIEGYFMLSF